MQGMYITPTNKYPEKAGVKITVKKLTRSYKQTKKQKICR